MVRWCHGHTLDVQALRVWGIAMLYGIGCVLPNICRGVSITDSVLVDLGIHTYLLLGTT